MKSRQCIPTAVQEDADDEDSFSRNPAGGWTAWGPEPSESMHTFVPGTKRPQYNATSAAAHIQTRFTSPWLKTTLTKLGGAGATGSTSPGRVLSPNEM